MPFGDGNARFFQILVGRSDRAGRKLSAGWQPPRWIEMAAITGRHALVSSSGGASGETSEKQYAASILVAAITETFSLFHNPRRLDSHPETLLRWGNDAPTITGLLSVREPHFRRFDRSVKPATCFSSCETGRPRSYTRSRCREASAFRVVSPVLAITCGHGRSLWSPLSARRARPPVAKSPSRSLRFRPKLSVVSLSLAAWVNGCCPR